MPRSNFGFGRPEHQSAGDGTELGGGTGMCDEAAGCAATNVGSEKHTVGPLCQRRSSIDDPGLLLDGKAFAGQHRFTDEEVVRLDDAGVGRDETARRQQHQIAGYDAPGVDSVDTAVANDLRADVYPGAECVRGHLRTVFARVAHGDGCDDDREHDAGVEPFTSKTGGGGRKDEQKQQWAADLIQQHTDSGQGPQRVESVRAVVTKTRLCLSRRQPLDTRAEHRGELVRFVRPERPEVSLSHRFQSLCISTSVSRPPRHTTTNVGCPT